MKILVAEDDAVTRKILAVTLERLGWDVVTAKDGDAALGGFRDPEGKRRAGAGGVGLDDARPRRNRDLPALARNARLRVRVRHSSYVSRRQAGSVGGPRRRRQRLHHEAVRPRGARSARPRRRADGAIFNAVSRLASPSSKRHSARCGRCRACCPFAATARKSETKRTTGSKSIPT